MTHKIAIITSSRADYGLLYHPIKELSSDPEFDVRLIVTGSHLVQNEGFTIQDIKSDGFDIFAEASIFSEYRTENIPGECFSGAVKSISESLKQAAPACVLILGDRYEILASAIAATLLNIPIAHLCGGDITEGAMDNALRHAITKLSHIHFPTNEQAARRILQMGESLDTIFMVGSPGLDYIRTCPILPKEEIFHGLSISAVDLPFLLITFHPVTLETDYGESQLKELFSALKEYTKNHSCALIFTGVNLDPGSETIYSHIIEFCKSTEECYYFSSVGSHNYINLMRYCQAVVGNSSSGFYEAPFLKKPTINVGTRQNGRCGCQSILSASNKQDILNSLINAPSLDLLDTVSPYGDSHSSKKIKNILKEMSPFRDLLMKKFKDIN